MKRRLFRLWFILLLFGITSCQGTRLVPQAAPPVSNDISTPTSDVISTRVAEEQTVAARLTATAAAARPTSTPLTNASPTPLPRSAPPATLQSNLNLQPTPTQTYFRLVNRHTQMCLTAPGASGPIVQATCSNARDDQFWRLPLGAVNVNLQARSGPCVGYDNFSNVLVQVDCSAVQPWKLVPRGTYYQVFSPIDTPHSHPTLVPLAIGTYYQMQYEEDCVDVDDWNHDDGGRIIHDTCRGTNNDNQLWARY